MLNDKWTRTGGSNYVLKGEDFFVSFLPGGIDLGMFSADSEDGETALVKDDKYYILNGDWTSQYEEQIPNGFDACHKVYEENIGKQSSWSN